MAENNNTPPQDPKASMADPKDKGFQAEPVSAVHAGKHAQSKQSRDESARKANDYAPEGENVVRQDIDNPNLHYGTQQDVMPDYYTAETEGGYSGSGGVAGPLNNVGNGDASDAQRGNAPLDGAGFTGTNGAGAAGFDENLDPNRSVLDDVVANNGLQGGNGPDTGGPLNNGLQTAANVADSSADGPSEPEILASVSPVTDANIETNAVNENASAGTVVGVTALATDADVTDTVTYSLSDDAGGLFTIDPNTGVVTTTGPLDAETATSHVIEVTATSTDGSTSTGNFTIAVNDLNESAISAISDTDGTTNEASEGASIGTAVGVTAFASDADVTDTVTYSLSNNPGVLFAIDANTGVVTVAGALDAETATSHVIEVTATSTDGSTSTADFTIAVTDVNEAAIGAVSDNDGTANAVDENASAGTVVGVTALATDADVTDTVTYSLSDDAGGLFTIDPNTGVVTTTGPLDAETATSHVIEVTATSTDGSTSTGNFTIAVNDLNEAPTDMQFTGNASFDSSSNTVSAGTVVAYTTDVSDDAGDTHTYSLVDNAGGKFTIDPNTGDVSLAADHDSSSAYQDSVTVRVTDQDGATYDEVVNIHIGTEGDDTITGTAGQDMIYGLEGESNISGGDGNDFILADTPTTSIGASETVGSTYSLIRLGNFADMDTNESNGTTENASDLLGTYGDSGSPLYTQIVSAVANDIDGDGRVNDNDYGNTAETMTIDGVAQTMDSTQVYNASVTFTDGTTGTFTAVVSQFENGDVYMNPEYVSNTDSALLNSKPIQSISLDSVSIDNTNLYANRLDQDYATVGENTLDGGAGDDVIIGSTGHDVIDGGADNDTIHGSPHTLIAHETFEGGATGWTNNATESSAQLTEFLGRTADTGHSGVDNAKTFALDAAKTGAVIEFDMHRIDSWDGEEFKVFIDGQEIAAENFDWWSDYTANETDTITIGDTTYTTSFVADGDRSDHSFAGWDEQTIKVRIEIENPGDTIELGFGSTINQDVSDESYGIDNVKIVSTDDLTIDPDAVIAEAGDTLTGGSGNDTIYGGAGDDTIQGDGGDDTVYAGAGNDTFDDAQANNGNDTVDMGAGNDTAWTGDGDDTLIGGEGDDNLYGEDGSDLFIFREGDGTDNVGGGAGGGWTDTIELQAADGGDVGAGWTYNITSGSVTNSGADFLELSDDASGSITLNDGSQVNFSEIERIEW